MVGEREEETKQGRQIKKERALGRDNSRKKDEVKVESVLADLEINMRNN